MLQPSKELETVKTKHGGKVFKNIWLISILVIVVLFIVLFAVNLLTGKAYNEFVANIFIFSVILSVPIGGISFLIWIFSLIRKRSTEKPTGHVSKFLRVVVILTRVALVLGGFLFGLFLIYLFILRPTRLGGSSMEPRLKNGDYLLTEKVSYYFHNPKRGDVVVYSLNTSMDDFIGRVVGLPSETLIIQKGKIEIDNNTLEEAYADWSGWEGKEPITIKLGGDEYLVLLDKRTISPVRMVGVKVGQFTGRVFYRYWPPSMAGFISP